MTLTATPTTALTGLLVRPDATHEICHLPLTDEIDSTDALQRVLGARAFDLISNGHFDAWLDDEGSYNGSERNLVATAMSPFLYGTPGNGSPLFGPVFITASPVGLDDSTQSLTAADLAELLIRVTETESYVRSLPQFGK